MEVKEKYILLLNILAIFLYSFINSSAFIHSVVDSVLWNMLTNDGPIEKESSWLLCVSLSSGELSMSLYFKWEMHYIF